MNTQKLVKSGLILMGITMLDIVGYSPGLLALSLASPSIVNTSLAILLGIGSVAGVGYTSYQLFLPDKICLNNGMNVTHASELLVKVADMNEGKFSEAANLILQQINSINSAASITENQIHNKFNRGSLTYNKYATVVDAAVKAAFNNINKAANMLSIIDFDRYHRAKNNYGDNIADESQKRQTDLVDNNLNTVHKIITSNEELILKLDELTNKIVAEYDESNNNDVLEEIKRLTEQLKIYE